jgi:glycosyltransferase involved in cell wall biosynthesis
MFDLSKIHVCFIAGNLGLGGAERQLFYIVQALHRCGSRPSVLCLTNGDYWEQRIGMLGIPVLSVGQAASRLRRLGRMVRCAAGLRPDVMQSQHFYTNLYAVAVARALGAREVGAVRNDARSEVRANGSTMGHLSLRAPRVLAANSVAGLDNAVALGTTRDKLHLLPNVIDTELFSPAAESHARLDDDAVRILLVGIRPEKRVDRFLAIFSRVRSATKRRVRAIIVGDGCDRAILEQRSRELGFTGDDVEFQGWVVVTAELYRNADVLVLTSDHEGTPNVVMEAMSAGLPVVATRVGGVPELVQHGETGFIEDPADEDAMVAALLALVEDQSLRHAMGRRGRAFIEEHHALQHLPGRLASLYEAVMS